MTFNVENSVLFAPCTAEIFIDAQAMIRLWLYGLDACARLASAGLYSEGILKPDEFGRVNSQHLKEAMVEVGSTVPNATSIKGHQVATGDIFVAI